MTRYYIAWMCAVLALAVWLALSVLETEIGRLAVKSFLETRGGVR